MENPLISIIIPVYNTEKYIKQCVDSVLAQTYKNLQILLVEDGATDSSAELCDQFAKLDNRIEVIHKRNEGLGLTRNCGLTYARGDYVTFLDSDDWLDYQHIEILTNVLADADYDIVFGSYTKTTNTGEKLDSVSLPIGGRQDKQAIRERIMLLIISADNDSRKDLGLPMGVCFNLYKLKIVRENKIEFPSERVVMSEDLFFNLRYLQQCKNAYVTDEVGYCYRYNPHSITKKYDKAQLRRLEKFYYEVLKVSDELKMPEITEFRIKRCIVVKLRGLLMTVMASRAIFGQKYKIVKEILDSEFSRKILVDYPMPEYRFSLKVTTFFMKKKLSLAVMAILKLNTVIRKK